MLPEEAKRYFSHAAAAGRVGHAYIVVGHPKGVASEFADFAMQRLTCREKDPPCGRCQTCTQIARGIFVDCLRLQPVKKSRIISVDQMRSGGPDNKIPPPYFLPWLNETSLLGGWKFGVIEFADRMNEPAANALLKTLEEPPPQTLLLLLTDAPQALLPTIVSRCETISLSDSPPELEGKYLEPLLSLLKSASHSGPFAANAYAQSILAILEAMEKDAEKSVAAELRDSDGISTGEDERKALVSAIYREKRSVLLLTLQRWFRDILSAKAGGAAAHLFHASMRDEIFRRAGNITMAAARTNIDAVESLAAQLEVRNMPDSVAFPYWLDRLDFGVEQP